MSAKIRGFLTLAACWLCVSHAHAQAPKEEARTRFNRGVELYRDGDLAGALAEFRKAHALAPSYRLQYNIAQVCQEQHDYACALTALLAFSTEGGAQVPSSKRASVEQEIQRVSAFVAELAVSVDTPGAEILLDDSSVGTAPLAAPLLVNAGRRRVSARQGALVATRSLEVAGGEHAQLSLLLTPSVETEPAKPKLAASEPAREVSPDRTLAWVSGVGAGVFMAGAAVTGVLALHESSQLSSERSRYPASAEHLHSSRDKISNLALATDILGLLALGSGVGAVYFALRPTSTTPSEPSAALSVSGRF